GGQDAEQHAGAEGPRPDGDRGGDGQDEADEREVVGGQPGAAQPVADRLDGALHGGPETPVEHGKQVTCAACGSCDAADATCHEPSVACPDTRAPGGCEPA